MDLYTSILLLLFIELISIITGFEKSNDIDKNIELNADSGNYDIKIVKKRSVFNLNNEINSRVKRQMKKDIMSLWVSPINFAIERGIDKKMLRHLLKEIEIKTCIRFREVSFLPVKPGIYFRYRSYCDSRVGKKVYRKWQEVFLGGENCSTPTLYLQQILRTLGMYFEQNRYDRNSYVKVFYENIKPGFSHSFYMLSRGVITTHKLPYDYGSIMHFNIRAYSKNNNYTIIPLDYLYAKTLGSSTSLSFIDYKLLNLHYCKRRCKHILTCLNSGYQNPNTCDCICVKGFVGKRCENFQPPLHSSCGKSVYKVEDYAKTLKISGAKKCLYHLIARSGKKIIFTVQASIHPNSPYICTTFNSVEVKYYKDKTVTGARICGFASITDTKSGDNHIIIYYKSIKDNNYVTFRYKEKSYKNKFNRGRSLIDRLKYRKYSPLE